MTYIVTAPNAGQSPGLFPPQANANFQRLLSIINAEHVFNLSAAASDGIHKQVQLINRGNPPAGPLASGANGMFYCQADTNGVPQLMWYNGGAINQITPGILVVKGKDTFNAGQKKIIFPYPNYPYVGYLFAGTNGGTTINQSLGVLYGDGTTLFSPSNQTSESLPFFLESNGSGGFDLKVANGLGSSRDIIWALQIMRIPN